jgi:hypothetical protein
MARLPTSLLTRLGASALLALAACSGGSGGADAGPTDAGPVDAGPVAQAPTVASVAPSSGPLAGGTAVTVTGAHFLAGATVRFGGVTAREITVVSATQLTATTPAAAAAGTVDVVVVNPNGRLATLSQAFTYAAAATPKVDWCNLQFPADTTGAPFSTLMLYGRVYKQGVTDGQGQGADIRMEAGISDADGGLQWVLAAYNKDVDGSAAGDHANDEYQLSTKYPDVGTYTSAFRASYQGGDWTYCEKDGPHAALDPAQLGRVVSAAVTPGTIDWCNLQFPTDTTGTPGSPLTLFGRVFKADVTTAAGPGAGVTMEAGLADADGGFTWSPATFNQDTDQNANDEFQWVTTYPAAVGTYRSAFRAQLNGGAWSYCEVDGIHAALDVAHLGTVTVQPPAADEVDWCNLQFPTAATLHPGDALTLFGQSYKAGLTDSAGAGAGIAMQAGVADATGVFTWTDATFHADVGNNDEYQWVTTAPAIGHHTTAYRARLNTGPWTYCGPNGKHAALNFTDVGTLDVTAVPPAVVTYCNLQFPTAATSAPGAAFDLYGQVYQPGVTEAAGAGPGIAMQGGLSLEDGGWQWGAAGYSDDQHNNDEYLWSTTAPTTPGTYRTAYRAALDGGDWVYCETDGLHATLDPALTGTLTVQAAAVPQVGFCNLQFPTSATLAPGAPLTLYGQVYEVGVTEAAGAGAGIHMQGGLSLEDGGWSWADSVYNGDQGNNDEYKLDAAAPAAVGTYRTAFRAQVDGGAWSYCETDGLHAALDVAQAGTLTVQAQSVGAVGWCNLQFPTAATAAPGAALSLFGRVYQQGVTDGVGQGAGVELEAGISTADGGWVWQAARFNVDADGVSAGDHANDEYALDTTAPAPGTYDTAFRARLTGGAWTYCEVDGPHAALDPTAAGQLTVTAPKVQWCALQFPVQTTGPAGSALSLYGQVYQPGLTDQAGQGAGVVMEAGLGLADGGWSWSATVFNGDRGNNDEYRWDGVYPAAGTTVASAFRVSLQNGPWVYCETTGPSDALDLTKTGSITGQ